MKRKLLPGIWSEMKYAVCVFVLPCFLYSGLWANDKKLPITNPENTLFVSDDETYNFQDITITGKITDEAGKGVSGVNVIEKGSRKGAVTDADGNYTLTVKGANSILVVTSVGYTSQEITVGSSSVINIKMESSFKKT